MSMHRLRISRWPVPSVRLRVKSLKERWFDGTRFYVIFILCNFLFRWNSWIEILEFFAWISCRKRMSEGLINKFISRYVRIYEIDYFVIHDSAYIEIQIFHFFICLHEMVTTVRPRPQIPTRLLSLFLRFYF